MRDMSVTPRQRQQATMSLSAHREGKGGGDVSLLLFLLEACFCLFTKYVFVPGLRQIETNEAACCRPACRQAAQHNVSKLPAQRVPTTPVCPVQEREAAKF